MPALQPTLLVVRVDRGRCTATDPLDPGGEDQLVAVPPRLQVAVGDRISVDAEGRVDQVQERTSALARQDPSGAVQILAANVDLVLVAHPLDRPLRVRRLERELVLAWDGGATPLLVLTKADLADDLPAALAEAASAAPGVDAIAVSVRTGEGLDDLRARLTGRTTALLGASGVGKSSLVNALLGSDVAATTEVRAVDGKGRHTTVSRDLYTLPGGGALVDSPGLRGVGLVDAEVGLEAAFADIEELAAGCRFADCAHSAEPGCAVQAAVADQTLSADRFEGWGRLRRDLDRMAAAQDPRATAAQRQAVRALNRAMRAKYARGD